MIGNWFTGVLRIWMDAESVVQAVSEDKNLERGDPLRTALCRRRRSLQILVAFAS